MEPSRFATLTERQRDCLRLLAEPMRQKEIASKLGVSLRTVEDHLASAVIRLGARSSLHAARLFTEYERGTTPGNIRPENSTIGETAVPPPLPIPSVDDQPALQGRLIRIGVWERSAIIAGLTVALIFSVFILVAGGETIARILKDPHSASTQ